MTDYTVYILKCSDGTLYTGITNDLDKRILTHNKGKGAKYTRGRLPVALMAFKNGLTKSEALKLEYKVKQQKKENKIEFLTTH
jgi:putative endonuclease